MGKSLTSRTIYGIKWSTLSTAATSLMQIGYTAIMARLLDPAAFGLVAMAGVVLRFGSFFADMGMSQAIIQKETLSQKDIRSAFTSSLLLAIIFLVFIWTLAPLAVYIFDNKEVVPVIRIMVWGFVVIGFSSTSLSLIKRRLQFKKLAIIEIISYILAYGCLGIWLAYNDFGVLSLVYATIFQAVLLAMASYFIVRHNVILFFSWTHYKPLLSFGGKFSVSSFLGFIGNNLDTLLIGKILGAGLLGIYNRAYMLIRLPVGFLTNSITRVIFPVWSNLQGRMEQLKKVYLSTLSLAGYFLMPVCFGAAIASEQIVHVMLGDQWLAAIPVLQILALSIPIHFITTFGGILCDVTAKLEVKIKLNLAYIFILIFLFYLLSSFGLTGFAFALLLAIVIRHLAMMFISKSILKFQWREFIKIYTPGIFSGVATGVVVFIMAYIGSNLGISHLPLLLLEVFSGFLSLVILLFLSPNKAIKTEISSRFLKSFDTGRGNSRLNKIFLKTLKILDN